MKATKYNNKNAKSIYGSTQKPGKVVANWFHINLKLELQINLAIYNACREVFGDSEFQGIIRSAFSLAVSDSFNFKTDDVLRQELDFFYKKSRSGFLPMDYIFFSDRKGYFPGKTIALEFKTRKDLEESSTLAKNINEFLLTSIALRCPPTASLSSEVLHLMVAAGLITEKNVQQYPEAAQAALLESDLGL